MIKYLKELYCRKFHHSFDDDYYTIFAGSGDCYGITKCNRCKAEVKVNCAMDHCKCCSKHCADIFEGCQTTESIRKYCRCLKCCFRRDVSRAMDVSRWKVAEYKDKLSMVKIYVYFVKTHGKEATDEVLNEPDLAEQKEIINKLLPLI